MAGQLYVLGGVRNWTAANAGIEGQALTVATSGGTTSLDKTAFKRQLDALGASMSAESRTDFSCVGVKTPVAGWDDAFVLLADAFRHPVFPPSEVELARSQALSGLHHEAESPDGRLSVLEEKQLFAGHPYANRPTGTLESVAAIKAADLEPYIAHLRQKSRFLFVAVGDVDPAHVIDQVRRAYGDLPQGDYVDSPIPALAWNKPQLVTEERKIPTNYIQGAFVMPHWSDPDWVAARVTMNALSRRLWDEVRTKRNLSYAPEAYVNTSFAQPFGIISVTAVDPNTTVRVMLDELRRMVREPLSDADLAAFKSVYLTDYLLGHEVPESQAVSLAEAQLYAGDWHLARTVPDRVRAVTAADVQLVAKKYFGNLQMAVLGDPSKIDRSLFTSL